MKHFHLKRANSTKVFVPTRIICNSLNNNHYILIDSIVTFTNFPVVFFNANLATLYLQIK